MPDKNLRASTAKHFSSASLQGWAVGTIQANWAKHCKPAELLLTITKKEI
jgi:hypothetical protein